jgi:hypothetical protein
MDFEPLPSRADGTGPERPVSHTRSDRRPCGASGRIFSSRCHISGGRLVPAAKPWFFDARRRTDLAEPDDLVEPDGIEPTTSCLQSRRSPN